MPTFKTVVVFTCDGDNEQLAAEHVEMALNHGKSFAPIPPFEIGESQIVIDAREAITRIQRMRDDIAQLPEDEEAHDDALWNMDSEDYGRYQALNNVLDMLHILALGGTPAQGE